MERPSLDVRLPSRRRGRRAVADRAEVTHTLVLYHFHSKEQLWIATIGAALRVDGGVVRACF